MRAALLDLRAADQQLQAAQTNVQLADDAADAGARSLRRRRRQQPGSDAGAGSGRHRVGAAYIAALYSHNLAKASLARSLGIAESAVMNYLGGRQ